LNSINEIAPHKDGSKRVVAKCSNGYFLVFEDNNDIVTAFKPIDKRTGKSNLLLFWKQYTKRRKGDNKMEQREFNIEIYHNDDWWITTKNYDFNKYYRDDEDLIPFAQWTFKDKKINTFLIMAYIMIEK